jgi:hypothetical protein
VVRSGIRSPLRKTLLPTTDLAGDFLITERTVEDIFNTLRQQSQEGPASDGNEGLVFLAGWRTDLLVFYSTVIGPRVQNNYGSVFVTAAEFGHCAKRARHATVQILAQVHSHPDTCCHHSDGDDKLIILPFEGMLSVVVPHYGTHDVPLTQCGIHQYRKGAWCLCTESSVQEHFITAPSSILVI